MRFAKYEGQRPASRCELVVNPDGRECRQPAAGYLLARPAAGGPLVMLGTDWRPFSYCESHADRLAVDLALDGLEVRSGQEPQPQESPL